MFFEPMKVPSTVKTGGGESKTILHDVILTFIQRQTQLL